MPTEQLEQFQSLQVSRGSKRATPLMRFGQAGGELRLPKGGSSTLSSKQEAGKMPSARKREESGELPNVEHHSTERGDTTEFPQPTPQNIPTNRPACSDSTTWRRATARRPLFPSIVYFISLVSGEREATPPSLTSNHKLRTETLCYKSLRWRAI